MTPVLHKIALLVYSASKTYRSFYKILEDLYTNKLTEQCFMVGLSIYKLLFLVTEIHVWNSFSFSYFHFDAIV